MTNFKVYIIGICSLLMISSLPLEVNGFTTSKGMKPIQFPKNTAKPPLTTSPAVKTSKATRGGTGNLGAWPLNKDPKGMAPDYPLAFARIGITVASTFVTWYAQNQYSSVMASSAFTLICSMVFDKRLGQAAFCGTFAGMCSSSVIPSWTQALTLGVMTSAFFETLIHTKNAFLGVGGRLGMTAFIATSILAAISNVSTGFSFSPIAWEALQKSTIVSMALWHAVGSVATIALREASDDYTAADPVRASAVVGLAGALLLQDKTAALALYGGSFVGMSLPSRLIYGAGKVGESTVISLLTSFALAGALGGVIHGITNSFGWWLGGWGGKAGTCAFLGCLTYRAIRKTVGKVIAFAQ